MQDTGTEILKRTESLFMRYGIKSITMDDIAKELGISKKTLYQFVENKADLIKKIVYQHIQEEKKEIESIRSHANNAVEEVLALAKYVVQALRQMAPTTVYDLQKYYHDSWKLLESLHQQHVYSVIRENLETGIRQGLYRPDIDPDIVAKLYVGKTFLLVNEEVFPLRDYTRERLLHEFFLYHLHGICSPKGREQLEQYLNPSET
ncbi:MAG: TetR/AcrR family transcriptional regulator [Saprospiraceae bacterium]|nr:TetR/AcrR family transcriptional regulator [Saprospiraceae bacterium]MCB0625055.1 TetR/AcrR family transcriptional regulator [Saprospiraceae bacterium]MCB0682082.1 TetR/AcrR family transcriptional regulator [Saprospiraceae bacterium]